MRCLPWEGRLPGNNIYLSFVSLPEEGEYGPQAKHGERAVMMMRGVLAGAMLFSAAAAVAAPSLQLPMKLDYAEGVIMRSKSAERIEQSSNDEAKAKLAEARSKYQAARQAQRDGDFSRSEQLANEAIRLVTAAAMQVLIPLPRCFLCTKKHDIDQTARSSTGRNIRER